MNWRKALEWIIRWWFLIAAGTAGVSFVISLAVAPTDPQNPGREAGMFAPVIAICVAAMLLAEALNARGLQLRRTPGILIALGSMASAYLWMAAESGTHPREPALIGTLALIFSVGALAALAVPMTALLMKSQSADQSTSD